MSTVLRISDDLAESARREGSIESRSMPEQVEHWAILGRKFAPLARPYLRIEAFKKGELNFDDLSFDEREKLTEEVLLTPSNLTFDPRVTGEVAYSRDEELDKPIEFRPDGTAWLGHYDIKDNYKFVVEKKIPWPVIF